MAEDLISCLICGYSAQTLARHLKASHGITAEDYRQRYPGARIRSEACEANRRAAIAQAHAAKPRAGLKKTVVCPCGASHEVGATSASKDLRCPVCRVRDAAQAEEARWAGKEEGLDYVVCCLCGHRAENLTSHVTSVHPKGYPDDAPMVAQNSAVRDKTALKGKVMPDDVRARMSANAGRWNAGLTKDTDERVKAISDHRMGQPSWSKGLTKDSHPSLRSTSEKISALKTGQACTNGLKADLSEIDFTPYLDATGAVDRKAMAEELGLSEITVSKYVESLGLHLSDERMSAAAERRVIRLERETLEAFMLGNGKVVIGTAMAKLGHGFGVIKRECARHGLPTYHHHIRQSLCLEAVSRALGGVPYEMEWSPRRFTNPPTGHRFRFDGYFPSHALVVEFHGYQHWTFPSMYIKQREIFDALVERDRVKAQLIRESGDLCYLELREDEPYTDAAYLRERLLDALLV